MQKSLANKYLFDGKKNIYFDTLPKDTISGLQTLQDAYYS